jgi:hypothetical protein
MCSGSRTRCGRAEVGAGMPAAHVTARRSSGSGRDSVSWWKKAAGRSKAAVGQGAMRGIAGKQEVALGCCDGEQRRGAARADSRAAWQK